MDIHHERMLPKHRSDETPGPITSKCLCWTTKIRGIVSQYRYIESTQALGQLVNIIFFYRYHTYGLQNNRSLLNRKDILKSSIILDPILALVHIFRRQWMPGL